MIASTEHKSYQKLLKKGSILKGIRTDKGLGRGLIAGGVFLFIVGLLFTFPDVFVGTFTEVIVGILPGAVMILLGIRLKKKREEEWTVYYQKETGFTEAELQRIDRELTASSVRLVIGTQPNGSRDSYVVAFITERYFVMNGMCPYVCRLEDMIAVGFSDSTDIWSMKCLTKRDKDTTTVGLVTTTERKVPLYREIIRELYYRNPDILFGQDIFCEGKHYILERDGAELVRLYREGRTLTTPE